MSKDKAREELVKEIGEDSVRIMERDNPNFQKLLENFFSDQEVIDKFEKKIKAAMFGVVESARERIGVDEAEMDQEFLTNLGWDTAADALANDPNDI